MAGKNQNPKKSLRRLLTKPQKKNPGPKSKPKKSDAEYMSHKDFQKALNIKKSSKKGLAVLKSQNYATEIRGHYHESSDCFEYPNKITYLKKDTQKNTCKMFLPQTTQAQKGPLIIPVTIRSTPPPPTSPG